MRLGMGTVGGVAKLLVQQVDGPWVDATRLSPSILDLIENWERNARVLSRSIDDFEAVSGEQISWLPPIPRPSKILAVGRNFAEHAEEQGAEVPTEPIIFCKLPSAIIGHEASVELPRESGQVDFEGELVAVIGKRGRRVSRAGALSHVAGYTCGNDITARDWQKGKPGGQWLLGKSFDTFAPTGPWLVTSDEIPDPQNLQIGLTLNGTVMQAGSTSQQLFPLAELIAYLSRVTTLEPGDLIFTGTPPGVGAARTPPVFLKSGDVLEVTVQQIGTLRNTVA